MQTEIPIIVLAPLAGALILGLFGRRMGERVVSIIACSTVAISAVLAFHVVIFNLFSLPEAQQAIPSYLFTWINVGNFRADFAFLVDPLSGIYILFITFVAFWIHVFATGYMHDDPGYARFFTYMNLFMFSMLTLILANNFLLMFVGWEGVGLCSYLLIGFWYKDKNNGKAGNKAFIFNRVGDFGFALGVMLLFWKCGSLFYFDDPQHGIRGAFNWAMTLPGDHLELAAIFGGGITTIAVLLFVGATGKSAQIPLYVWLPDAMAGPTPVSALIHAATMVTAGVYMISRSSAIYVHAPAALFIVALVGAVTAFFAATIGIAQWDIKKVLAYSTISQLGYMFLACGVGAFGAGVFHVVTHAFFKALLFLCAGSIILALHHEQDMRKMGGLAKYLPTTFLTMVAAWLAISGVPGLSGFFSKDAILASAFNASSLFPAPWPKIFWVIGIVTALLTAIYMTRLMVMTFWGDERFRAAANADSHSSAHGGHGGGGHDSEHGPGGTPREPSMAILIPLIVLAIGAVVVGYLNLPKELYGNERFSSLIERSIATKGSILVGSQFVPHVADEAAAIAASPTSREPIVVHEEEHGGRLLMTISALIAVGGIVFAMVWFQRSPLWQPPRILEEKYKVDELYDATVIQPVRRLSTSFLWKIVDVEIIDGTVNGIAQATALLSKGLRHIQSGVARRYVATVVFGAIVVIGYFVIR